MTQIAPATDMKFAETINNQPNPNPINPDPKKDPGELSVKIYTDEDKEYLSYLQKRLVGAKNQKNQVRPEFNNKTYYHYYEENERIANTLTLNQKVNEDDVDVSSGTVEQKLDSLLSHINNLNFETDVIAFDKRNNRIGVAGTALTDIIHDVKIQDGADGAGDEEKKIQRQRELLKQGTVFVQKEWITKFEKKGKSTKQFNGSVKDYEGHTKNLEKVFDGPSSTLLYGPNVYQGDITQFYNDDQPYMFVVIHQDYEEAKKRYGGFDRWDYVQPGNVPASTEATTQENKTIFDNKWRLTDIKENQVEIILYQDQPGDEFQIIINGVLMLPIGFPLSEVTPLGKYNIVKQTFRIINNQFAYGGSFVSSGSVKQITALMDEMLKLFVLKTRKSFTPAYVNNTGKVIDKKVLSPGRISMGFDASALTPIEGNEVQGITAGETGFFEKLQTLIDKSTVSEQFTGQKQGGGGQTATETLELQRQAKLTLGLTIAAAMLLEKKLDYLTLLLVLQRWTQPTGERVVEVEGARKLVKEFRNVTRETNIEGEGIGERSIMMTDEKLPSDKVIRKMEIAEEKEKGFPVRKVFLNPDKLKHAIKIWYVVVNPKEKESSPFFKLMFREMLNDLLTLTQFGSRPNLEGLEEEFSRLTGRPRNKLFQKSDVSSDELAGLTGPGGANSPEQNKQASGRSDSSAIPASPAGT